MADATFATHVDLQSNELRNFRVQTVDTLPTVDAAKVGSVLRLSTDNKLYHQTPTAWEPLADAAPGGAGGAIFDVPAGVGGATDVAVTHNLNSEIVDVTVVDVATKKEVDAGIVFTDANTVTLSFGVAPTAGQYKALVTKVSAAQPTPGQPTVTATPGPNKLVSVTVDNHGNGPVNVDFGDTPAVPAVTNAGDNTATSTHTYTSNGPQVTITVTDADNPALTATQQVTLQTGAPPAPQQPTVTATPKVGKVVDVTVDNHGSGPVTVAWGDTPATLDGANAGDNTAVTSHTYTTTGQVTITVTDADDPTLTATQQVTLLP